MVSDVQSMYLWIESFDKSEELSVKNEWLVGWLALAPWQLWRDSADIESLDVRAESFVGAAAHDDGALALVVIPCGRGAVNSMVFDPHHRTSRNPTY